MSEAPRKRSRFDQTDNATADPRRSRFDRRSRSPADREPEARKRSRSPAAREVDSPASETTKSGTPAGAAAAAAAAAAARINAQIQAKKAAGGITMAPVRPIQASPADAPAMSPSAGGETGKLNDDIYEQDGDWIKDIEVNDLRNRYTLTKGATQKMIKDKTGADVTTRGAYYPDKTMATAANPPLYLHITSQTKEGLEAAIAEIDEMMKQDLPNLIDERRIPRRREPDFERDERGRRKWPDERIPIQLEPINGFNLRAQVVGQGGMYVKHIQQETSARVQIKGRGSGFYEHDTGVEADEPMYLHVTAPGQDQVDRAKELCVDLLANVRSQYEQFKERGGSRGFGGDRRGGGGGGGGYGDGDRDRSQSYGGGYNNNNNNNNNAGYGGGGYGGTSQYGNTPQYGGDAQPAAAQGMDAMSPAAGGQDQAAQMAAWAQWAQTNPDQANAYFAAYGGYEAYMKMYASYYTPQAGQNGAPAAQQQQQQGYGGYDQYAAMQNTGGNAAAPPPPPGDDAAPPPPPPSNGGYNSVPPPPGL